MSQVGWQRCLVDGLISPFLSLCLMPYLLPMCYLCGLPVTIVSKASHQLHTHFGWLTYGTLNFSSLLSGHKTVSYSYTVANGLGYGVAPSCYFTSSKTSQSYIQDLTVTNILTCVWNRGQSLTGFLSEIFISPCPGGKYIFSWILSLCYWIY